MSGPLHAWYSPRDLEALASRAGTLGGELTVGKLARLKGMLASDVGSVHATLRFRQRGANGYTVELEYRASLMLVCQRCLEPFRHEMSQRVNVCLVDADLPTSADQDFEPYELEGGRFSPASLIEDELIVSVPLVPKHSRREDCGSLAGQLASLVVDGDEAADR